MMRAVEIAVMRNGQAGAHGHHCLPSAGRFSTRSHPGQRWGSMRDLGLRATAYQQSKRS